MMSKAKVKIGMGIPPLKVPARARVCVCVFRRRGQAGASNYTTPPPPRKCRVVGAEIWEGDGRRELTIQCPAVHGMAPTSSVSGFSCVSPCPSLHSLNALPAFIEKALFFADFRPLHRIPGQRGGGGYVGFRKTGLANGVSPCFFIYEKEGRKLPPPPKKTKWNKTEENRKNKGKKEKKTGQKGQ